MKRPAQTFHLRISSGSGPHEVRTFARLLGERLIHVCINAGLELIDGPPPAESRPTVSLCLRGDPAALSGLLGTHALVLDCRRQRAGRHRGHRKRWFVHVYATAATRSWTTCLDLSDVALQFSRSGGPGGQHVNTSATAVRAVHIPTGLAVRVSDSRSQAHNRELALVRLAAKLDQRGVAARQLAEQQQHVEQRVIVRGDPVAIWRMDERAGLCRA